jgi:hypothetical protein
VESEVTVRANRSAGGIAGAAGGRRVGPDRTNSGGRVAFDEDLAGGGGCGGRELAGAEGRDADADGAEAAGREQHAG